MERDKIAINLLRDFVKDKLGGDINKLLTYNLKTLEDERKYGDNYFEHSSIVKAIMSIAFADVWSGLSIDTINKGKFECGTINKYQNLFGINMFDQYFKGLQKFNPSVAQHQRALKVAHMSYSVGNLWVLPCLPSIASRVLDNSYRYYIDQFLLAIYNVMVGKKRVDKTLQAAIAKNKLMDVYKGEEGFGNFVKDMMLDDYLDYYGKPTEVFPFIWSGMKDLSKDSYFDAVDLYCTFCEKFIPKRADRIIEKLNIALAKVPSVQKTSVPIAITERPTINVERPQEESNVLNRYALAYHLITKCLDFAKADIDVRLPLLADKEYYMTLAERMNLKVEGFSWNDFTITVEDTGIGVVVIFFSFPQPQKEPEALYGAIMVDQYNGEPLSYYTFEKCIHPGLWALGRNSLERHELFGMFEIEPSKENFLDLIFSKKSKSVKVDIKDILNLPENFQVLKNLPKDPINCVNYGIATSQCQGFIQAFAISIGNAMPFDDTKAIIDGIHHSLEEKQALIEVKNGVSKNGRQYVYSIVKTQMEPSGIEYIMLMHVSYDKVGISINGHFLECGMTGMRDTTVWEMAYRQNLVSAHDNKNWWFDPYDKDFKHPFLMNLSEQEDLDALFPEHPLSQCRKFIKLITQKL